MAEDVYAVRKSLGISDVLQILQNPPANPLTSPPQRPKANQVYVFRAESAEKEDDWRSDQYRWVNQGVAKLPRKGPRLRKLYFVADTPGGPSKDFQRHAYQLLDSKLLTVIHYVGDESAAVDFPHRGVKEAENGRNFVRTCKSYLREYEDKCKHDKANVVYKREVAAMSCKPECVPVQIPRNMKQLRNLRYKHLNESRISRDALYNLHEIAYDIPGFTWKITTFPDLLCICGLQEILEEADNVLTLKSSGQLLSYDTTFQMGDFYVSPVVFRHTLFTESPSIPAMFLIHERKVMETHHEMMRECAARIPALKKTTLPVVTDREKAIVNAIKQNLPAASLVYCWNHVLRDIKHWLQQHGAPATEVAVYMEDVFQLLHSPSAIEYNTRLKVVRQRWDAVFEEYYMKYMHPDVPTTIGRWVLEALHIYNPYSGVTNIQSEGFNRVMKDLQGWKEAPLDCVVLALFLLQAFYANEIKRGLSGMGEFHVIPSMRATQLEHFSHHFIPTASPDEIIENIRSRKLNEDNSISEKENATTSSASSDPPTRDQSAHARASEVVRNNSISFDPKLHVFNVKGTSGVTRVVTLHPRETCSCPSTGECYHILATKYSIGIPPTSKRPVSLNLSQLRRNTRSKKDKKSGRKRPRPNDLDPVKEDADSSKRPRMDDGELQDNADGDGCELATPNPPSKDKATLKPPPVATEDETLKSPPVPTEDETTPYQPPPVPTEDETTPYQPPPVPSSNQTPKEKNRQAMKLFAALQAAIEAARKRASKQKKKEDPHVFVIDEVADDTTTTETPPWINCELFKLEQRDLKVIESGGCLTDNIIDAAQRILSHQFYHKFHGAGFQHPILSEAMSFDIETSGFIQILHNGCNHWLLASTNGCPQGTVSIYDSLYSNTTECVQQSLACLMKVTHEAHVTLNFANVHKQSGSSDCGVFTIAYATALCFGVEPGKVVFDQAQMRKHLVKCLEAQSFTMFPVRRERRTMAICSTQKAAIYCVCRMPHMNLPMVECSRCREWYHGGVCIDVPEAAWSSHCKWLCHNCVD